jgi:hypothetical protein
MVPSSFITLLCSFDCLFRPCTTTISISLPSSHAHTQTYTQSSSSLYVDSISSNTLPHSLSACSLYTPHTSLFRRNNPPVVGIHTSSIPYIKQIIHSVGAWYPSLIHISICSYFFFFQELVISYQPTLRHLSSSLPHLLLFSNG